MNTSSEFLFKLLPEAEHEAGFSETTNSTSGPDYFFFESEGWTSFLTGVVFWLAVIVSCSACCRNFCKTVLCDIPTWVRRDLCGVCFPQDSEQNTHSSDQSSQSTPENEIMLQNVRVDHVTASNPPLYDVAINMPKPEVATARVAMRSTSTQTGDEVAAFECDEVTRQASVNNRHTCLCGLNTSACSCTSQQRTPHPAPPTYSEALDIIQQLENRDQE